MSKYKYLGVILCAYGKIQRAINDRICKANRALFLLKQMLSSGRSNISPKLSLSMFDKQIMPILLYGCTLWSLPNNWANIYFNLPNIDTKNVRQLIKSKINDITSTDMKLESVRTMGKAKQKKVLVSFMLYSDKKEFIRLYNRAKSNLNWTIEVPNSDINEHCIESFHCKFLKYILGVNK